MKSVSVFRSILRITRLKGRTTASPRRWQILFEIKQISLNPHQKFDPADGYLKQVLASAGLTSKKHASNEINSKRPKSALENAATEICLPEAKNCQKGTSQANRTNWAWLRTPSPVAPR